MRKTQKKTVGSLLCQFYSAQLHHKWGGREGEGLMERGRGEREIVKERDSEREREREIQRET